MWPLPQERSTSVKSIREQLEAPSNNELLGEGLVARLRDWEIQHRLWAAESGLRGLSDRELLGDLIPQLREIEIDRRLEQLKTLA